MQTTALVNEAYLKLIDQRNVRWQNRAHFFGIASQAMRRILIDRARSKRAERHGGGQERIDIDEIEIVAEVPDDELLAVHEALDRFAANNPQKAELVKLRYFAGLTMEEAAELLEMSPRSAYYAWSYARSWLHQAIT